jgi:hypothetical protein
VLDLEAGAKSAVRSAAIVHHELGAAPAAVEIEVPLLLAYIHHSKFQ